MTLLEHLSKVPDFRRRNKNFRHELVDILALSVLGVLSGAEDFEEIAWFGEQKKDFLRQFLSLSSGVPSHDTIRRVLMHIDSSLLNQAFMDWIHHHVSGKFKQVSIDGKVLRGSAQGRHKPLHLVSAVASELGLSLGQYPCADKSNEITAIPALLELLYIEGCIVSIDAMGCQSDIAQKIVDQKADYFLAVKGNQAQLRAELETELDRFGPEQAFRKYDKQGSDYLDYQVWVSDHLDWIDESAKWPGLASVVKVQSHRYAPDKAVQVEQRYYITSLEGLEAKQAYQLSRQHWSIENQLHWQLDITLREDQKTIRDRKAAQNMALIRKMALNLLSLDQSVKASKKKKIKKAAWDNQYLMHLISLSNKL